MKLEVPLSFLSDYINFLRTAAKTPDVIETEDGTFPFSQQTLPLFEGVAELFDKSVKLILPLNGVLLDELAVRCNYNAYMKMPFPCISGIYKSVDEEDNKAVSIITWVAVDYNAFRSNDAAKLSENSITFYATTHRIIDGKYNTFLHTIKAILIPNKVSNEEALPFDVYLYTLSGKKTQSEDEEIVDMIKPVLSLAARSLTDVLLAFNIERGVRYEDLPVTPEVSHKLNNKRAKRGKAPLYQYRILDLNADRIVYNKDKTAVHTHASPRAHMRRAHIRHLENKAVWVRECMVNAGMWEHVDNPIYVGRKAHG